MKFVETVQVVQIVEIVEAVKIVYPRGQKSDVRDQP
jgi:hypothetical protein